MDKNTAINDDRFLEFSLGTFSYALPLLSVKEVISVPQTRELPNSPDYFTGVIDLRGLVVPIIDLRKKLKIVPIEDQSESAVIIVYIGNIFVGILVDAISQVITIDTEKLEQHKASEAFASYIIGFHRNEDESFTALIDLKLSLDMQDISGIKNAIGSK